MGARKAFRPSVDGELEVRVVLSRMGIRQAQLAQVAARRVPPVINQINRAFDTFTQDYTQARAAYLAGGPTAPETGKANSYSSFAQYTRYRVNALGQQLNGVFLQASQQLKKGKSVEEQARRFASIVQRNVNGLIPPVNGAQPTALPEFQFGTLGRALTDTIPTTNEVPAVSLNILAQDQAIASARAGVINGFTLVKKASANGKS